MRSPAPPNRVVPKTAGGFTSAEAYSQTEQAIRSARTVLANCGVDVSQSRVSRMVRQFEHRIAQNGWRGITLLDFIGSRISVSGEQRRQMLSDPSVARVVAYADPTGESAVNNVMRGRKW